jgi:hypothetical protein
VKSIKSVDNTTKILPIRSNVKIYLLSTTDQINTLEHIGLINYFKPYKRTQKMLSGDFCISTRLTFRGCTFRGDLQDYIMSSAEWKATPFHFRLYFNAFTTKGKTSHVLMVDVDCPNIDLGIKFFQQWYNGELSNSPNNLPYMFWPLFKKDYMDKERLRIIIDNDHHIGSDSVIGLTGLQPLDSLVQLVNGKHTTIWRLLLSIPAAGTVTGQLFMQVECQTTNDWILCCFQHQDTSKVILRLGSLAESLRRCVHPTSILQLFLSSEGITFTSQVAQLTKGQNRLPRLEVPTHTENYISQSMQCLYTPIVKRLAKEMDPATSVHQEVAVAIPQTPQPHMRQQLSQSLLQCRYYQPLHELAKRLQQFRSYSARL